MFSSVAVVLGGSWLRDGEDPGRGSTPGASREEGEEGEGQSSHHSRIEEVHLWGGGERESHTQHTHTHTKHTVPRFIPL